MTTQEEREYVEARWESIDECGTKLAPIRIFFDGIPGHVDVFKDWHAAYEFTVQRKEEIRQLTEEIRWLKWELENHEPASLDEPQLIVLYTRRLCAHSRSLAARQAVLAELRRGMKELGKN
jgi:hypothetical protein